MICPCCSNKPYNDCCGRFLEQEQLPETPEVLMRSRYTAFTQARIDYIGATQRETAAKHFDEASTVDWAKSCVWQALKVLKAEQDGDEGQVEFVVRYQEGGVDRRMQELSFFKRIDGKWYYIRGAQGQTKIAEKVGRNEFCPCGSGKKYKKCCI